MNLKNNKLVSVVFIIVGILLIFFAFYTLHLSNSFYKSAKKTTATITDIKTKTTSSRKHRTSHSFIVSYNIGDTNYSNVDSWYYISTKNIGDSMTIYYGTSLFISRF